MQQQQARLARADDADSVLEGDAEKGWRDEAEAEEEEEDAEEEGDAQDGDAEKVGDEAGGDEEGGDDDATPDEPDEKLVCMWRQTGDCRADGPR